MPLNSFILRTIYIDEDIDEHLCHQATPLQLTKAALFRRYLSDGIKAARQQPALIKASATPTDRRPLVLRSVLLNPKVDDRLRAEAFDLGVTRNDLTRLYVRIGMNSAARAASP